MKAVKKRETPDALAARLADEHIEKIISYEVHGETDLDSAIEEVYTALGGDDEAEKDGILFGRAAYMVGVQVGLRLRGGLS